MEAVIDICEYSNQDIHNNQNQRAIMLLYAATVKINKMQVVEIPQES
jgi:hypothetical protein